MSYDDWLPFPYEVDTSPHPPEDERDRECAICGVGLGRNNPTRYCGDSCQMADEEGLGDLL